MPRRKSRTEQERWVAGLETGMLVGMVVGFLAGMWVGMLGGAASVWLHTVLPSSPCLTPLISNPMVTGILGAMIGVIAAGLIGWTVRDEPTQRGTHRVPRHLAGDER